jgi:hypothetical protein
MDDRIAALAFVYRAPSGRMLILRGHTQGGALGCLLAALQAETISRSPSSIIHQIPNLEPPQVISLCQSPHGNNRIAPLSCRCLRSHRNKSRNGSAVSCNRDESSASDVVEQLRELRLRRR